MLSRYTDKESIQVRTCINGTLYSLIKRKSIRNIARELGIDQTLINSLENPNDQMKSQIQHILNELNSEEDLEEASIEDMIEEVDEDDEMIDEEYVSSIIFYLI